MANQAMMPDAPLEIRLDHAVAYLNTHGYTASWHHNGDGHILSVTNCPYEQVSCSNPELCKMDKKLMDKLVGLPTQRVAWQQEEAEACMFLVKNGGA
jgi:predicted ArsR family transcriptional regulator